MKRILTGFFLIGALLLHQYSSSFCGFFVAKAGSKIFNESSQVILVRDGDFSAITMSNDFKGDVKDFAMVIPVPVILKRSDIEVADAKVFATLDNYSAPRLAEYFDSNPCQIYNYGARKNRTMSGDALSLEAVSVSSSDAERPPNDRYRGVKVEANYAVGEYDIMLLSAKENQGLQNWLNDNGYALPEKAKEVLEPYIKNKMNFFVAKVNLERHDSKLGFSQLPPLRIKYEHPKFMLPIRLGMANAKKTQDLVVYAFTKTGRIECTNYRTVNMPANQHIPEFVASDFGNFYKNLFDKKYAEESKECVFLEYAWDVSQRNSTKCDPCVAPAPVLADIKETGVNWLSSGYEPVFFTRLHVRYDRANFPQDLEFQITPNRQMFQCRYVMQHPYQGDLTCNNAQNYLKRLITQREKELETYTQLTGKNTNGHEEYIEEYARMINGGTTPKKENHNGTRIDMNTGALPPVPSDVNTAGFDAPDTRIGAQWVMVGVASLFLFGFLVARVS